jgi:Fe2+ transport system protein B
MKLACRVALENYNKKLVDKRLGFWYILFNLNERETREMQSKTDAIKETLMNTFSGFVVAYAITSLLFPVMDKIGPFWVTVIMTVVSLIRSYYWRRVFNAKATKKLVDMAKETC